MKRSVSSAAFFLLVGVLFLTLVSCSAKRSESRSVPQETVPTAATAPQPVAESGPDTVEADDQISGCIDPEHIRKSERDRAACFHHQPGTTTTKVVKHQVSAKNSKSAHLAKKGAKAETKSHVVTETKVVHTGRCQPQCVIYARCRTGVTTCRLGDTGPVQWFNCAAKHGATTSTPQAGSVMVLAGNAQRRMATGHVAYVEEAKKNQNGTWQLRLSHANYDRKCHLDQDAMVLFDPKRMTASFETGQWQRWAKDLKTLGFILR